MLNPSNPEKAFAVRESEEISSIDIIFQTQLYSAVEELRLRRENDVENEKKIQQLLNQKHELEKKLELQILDHRAIVERVEKSKIELRQEYEDKLHQLQEEKMRASVATDRFNKEIGIMKDEARALELEKHSLEKKLKEAEASVQVQSSVHDTTMQRYSDLGQVIDDVKKQHAQLQSTQQQIETKVLQVLDYIKKLEFCIRHSRCLFSSMEQDKTRLSEELIKSRAENLIVKPDNESTTQATLTTKVTYLEGEIKKLQEKNEKLLTEIQGLYNEKKMVLAALSEANAVTNKYMEQVSSAVRELEDGKTQHSYMQEQIEKQSLAILQLQQELQQLSSKACQDICTQTDNVYFKQASRQQDTIISSTATIGDGNDVQAVLDGSFQSEIEHVLDKLLDAAELFVSSS